MPAGLCRREPCRASSAVRKRVRDVRRCRARTRPGDPRDAGRDRRCSQPSTKTGSTDMIMYQIVNRRGAVVNGVWNGKTPMTRSEAMKKIALMHQQGSGRYKLKRVK